MPNPSKQFGKPQSLRKYEAGYLLMPKRDAILATRPSSHSVRTELIGCTQMVSVGNSNQLQSSSSTSSSSYNSSPTTIRRASLPPRNQTTGFECFPETDDMVWKNHAQKLTGLFLVVQSRLRILPTGIFACVCLGDNRPFAVVPVL